jgi:chemotaxis protein CheC
MADEVLAETGNIVLNGCLGAIANLQRHRLTFSLPRILRGDAAQLFEPAETRSGESTVLFVFVNFAMKGRNIRGYIALSMDLEALAELRRPVGEFIARSISDGT